MVTCLQMHEGYGGSEFFTTYAEAMIRVSEEINQRHESRPDDGWDIKRYTDTSKPQNGIPIQKRIWRPREDPEVIPDTVELWTITVNNKSDKQ